MPIPFCSFYTEYFIRLFNFKKIAESVTKPLSYNRLTNILKSSGTSLGKQTVINYVGYMTDSYLNILVDRNRKSGNLEIGVPILGNRLFCA